MTISKDRFFIKQFGLQRSGTNALKALLEVNFPQIRVLTTFLGNKHEPIDYMSLQENCNKKDYAEYELTLEDVNRIQKQIADRALPIIFQIKKPIPWFDSYFRYNEKKIKFRNPTANPTFNEEWVKTGLKYWNECLSSWIEFSKEYPNCVIIEHMDILTNPDRVIQDILSKFSFEKNKEIQPIENEMKRGHYKEHGENLINPYHKFDPSFHTEKKWLGNYSPELLEFAQLSVDELISNNPIFSEFGIDFSTY